MEPFMKSSLPEAGSETTAVSAETILEARSLSRTLRSGNRDLHVLQEVSFAIPRGQFAVIIGPSGSGKSTLLALLAGLDRPTSGSVIIQGQAIESLPEDQLALLRRQKVGFVFQSFHLLSNFTAVENVMLPLELLGRSNARQRAMELLDRVGLADRGHHYPAQLSGGEQQRVALARAFAPEPAVLLADEPTGNLDGENGRVVMDMMRQLRHDQGSTLILVTHDMSLTTQADRVIGLRDGRVVEDRQVAAEVAR
jgi:putative ABC transport system ATP-binding protein